MKNPPNSSEQALEDYFNDLLGEPAVAANSALEPLATTAPTIPEEPPQITPPQVLPVPPPLRTARLAHLPIRSAAPAVAATPLRAYAEPVRTLNLRMPLPSPAPVRPAVQEAPATEPLRPVPVVRVEPRPQLPAEVERPASRQPTAPIPPSPPQPEPAPTVVDEPVEIAAVEPAGPAPWLDNGRPAWAQRPFECLLFRVGGLALAAPLAELGSIYRLEPDGLTTIFGQAPWFMGLLPVKGYNVRTIDSAQVVMPERYSAGLRDQYRFVISLHGSDWGLAVDAVADSVILHPDDVRWRGARGKRPWLAGTVVERMCALLDVAQLVWMFEGQDGKRTSPRH
jgi:purine-binding chemotaxis protein CheW